MKTRWLAGLAWIILWSAPACFAQGQQITAGPFPVSGLLYVCPVPSGGTPCPAPVAIFSNAGLTTGISNPIVVSAQQTYTFFAASGQYTLEMPAAGYQQIVGGGGGGGATGSAATVLDAASSAFGVKADLIRFTDGSITGVPLRTVTCTSQCNFTTADVGKEISGWTLTCTAGSASLGSQVNVFPAGTTIASFTDSTHVVASATATGTAACIEYGTNNDAAFNLLDAALNAINTCPTVVLPSGLAMVDFPHMYMQPPGCARTPVVTGGSAGSTALEIAGQGRGTSGLELGNGFGGNIAAQCTHGDTGTACFAVRGNGLWRNWSISGGGETLNGANNGAHNLVEVDSYGKLRDMQFTNYGSKSTSALFMDFVNGTGGPTFMNGVALDGFATGVIGGGGNLFINDSVIGDMCGGIALDTGTSTLIDFTGGESLIIAGPCTPANANMLKIEAGATVSGSGKLIINMSNGSTTTNFGVNNPGNGVLRMCNLTVNGGVAASVGIANSSGGTVQLCNSTLGVTTAANSYKSTSSAASVLIDGGGNTITGSTITAGGVVNESASSNGVLLTAAKLVLSAGWGTTAAVTAPVGGDAPVQFTVTNSGTGQGASPTITYTFPTPYLVAPISCTATQIGGTNANGTFTSSALSATGVTFTFSLTPTAASTEIVQVTCVTP